MVFATEEKRKLKLEYVLIWKKKRINLDGVIVKIPGNYDVEHRWKNLNWARKKYIIFFFKIQCLAPS